MARTRGSPFISLPTALALSAAVAVLAIASSTAQAQAAPTIPAPPLGDPEVIPVGPRPSPEPSKGDLSIESRPLGTPHAPAMGADRADKPQAQESSSGWLRTVLALGAVITLLIVMKVVVQKLAGRRGGLVSQLGAGGRAPSGVLEVLGRYPVSRGHSLVLLRMDRRILLLGQSSNGFRMLTEVTDPEDVASLLIKTRDDDGASTAAKFTTLLREMERDPAIVADERGGTSLTEPGPSSPRLKLGSLIGVRA
jgi:flagellar biogenesis protein FliO